MTEAGEFFFYAFQFRDRHVFKKKADEAFLGRFRGGRKAGFDKTLFLPGGVVGVAVGGHLKGGERGFLFLVNDFELYPGDTFRGEADDVRRGPGKIDDPVFDEGTPVVYPHGDGFAVLDVRDEDLAPEGEGLVGGGELVRIEDLPVGGEAAVEFPSVPGGEAFLVRRRGGGRREDDKSPDEGRDFPFHIPMYRRPRPGA